jgi:hypothetical protein
MFHRVTRAVHQVVCGMTQNVSWRSSKRWGVSLADAACRLDARPVRIDKLSAKVRRVRQEAEPERASREVPDGRLSATPADGERRYQAEHSNVQVPVSDEHIVRSSLCDHFFLCDQSGYGCDACTDRGQGHQASSRRQQSVVLQDGSK